MVTGDVPVLKKDLTLVAQDIATVKHGVAIVVHDETALKQDVTIVTQDIKTIKHN